MIELVAVLAKKKLTLAACESLTGGLFASEMVGVGGASQVFLGGLVTYATHSKIDIAQVDPTLIDKYGVVSGAVAKAMAMNTCTLFHSDIAVSFTGNAGPEATEHKPVGLVYSAIAYLGNCAVYEDRLDGGRNEIREQVVALMEQRLLEMFRDY